MSDMAGSDLQAAARGRTQEGDLDGAASLLHRAIERHAASLADSHAMLGGVRKRAGDLAGAIDAYDAGFDIESRYELATSYNALNRLLVRALMAPACLVSGDAVRSSSGAAALDVPPSWRPCARSWNGWSRRKARRIGGSSATLRWSERCRVTGWR